jgi:hypothetical protein
VAFVVSAAINFAQLRNIIPILEEHMMNVILKIAASLNVRSDVSKAIIIEQYFDKSAMSTVVNHFAPLFSFVLCVLAHVITSQLNSLWLKARVNLRRK